MHYKTLNVATSTQSLQTDAVTKPYEFKGFGAMAVTKPYKFIGFGEDVFTTPSPTVRSGVRSGTVHRTKA